MKDTKQTPEERALKTVKGLANKLYFVALLLLIVGIYLLAEDFQSDLFRGSVVIGVGILFFAFGWCLFNRQSYLVAVLRGIVPRL